VSHLYNVNAKLHGGKVERSTTAKDATTAIPVLCLRPGARRCRQHSTQRLANRHLRRRMALRQGHIRAGKYKSPKRVIDLLVDIVSRNGNLMLNFPLPNSGELDSAELKILDEITKWMAVNSEGIIAPALEGLRRRPRYQGGCRKQPTVQREHSQGPDGRGCPVYHQAGALYAFVMGWPDVELQFPRSLWVARMMCLDSAT